MKSYGINKGTDSLSDDEVILEEIERKGFSIIPNYMPAADCDKWSNELEATYKRQVEEFGEENLKKINEENVCRSPLTYNSAFANVFHDDWIIELCEQLLEGPIQLHLQNGIINRPSIDHHQTSWHRDLPYQEYTTSSPLALNVFFCLTEFNEENGATIVLPYSHHFNSMPSSKFIEANSISVEAPKGSLILFDSFLYHRAGINSSNSTRYGLNHVFTRPFIKQQVNYTNVAENTSNRRLKLILGKEYEVSDSVLKYREKRLNR